MSGILKDLGPCQISFGGADLGATFGDVTFKSSVDSKPINEDSKGTTPVDEILVGASCEVEVPMTRSSLAQLAAIIPGGTVSGAILAVSSPVGQSMLDAADVLILKPYVGTSVATAESWLTIPLASPKTDLEITYNVEGQRVYKAIFKGFADANGLIWYVGDITA